MTFPKQVTDRIFLGFDAFIDTILSVVKVRRSAEQGRSRRNVNPRLSIFKHLLLTTNSGYCKRLSTAQAACGS